MTVAQLIKKFPEFSELKSILHYSQEPATGHHPVQECPQWCPTDQQTSFFEQLISLLLFNIIQFAKNCKYDSKMTYFKMYINIFYWEYLLYMILLHHMKFCMPSKNDHQEMQQIVTMWPFNFTSLYHGQHNFQRSVITWIFKIWNWIVLVLFLSD